MPPVDFDPSDWKKTKLPKLSQLDSLQRCLICKEFLKAPVITSCNHTFCSHCIRQHLLNESSCPLCKAEQFESNLKRVILLEEIVSCFQAVREDLIALVRASESPSFPDASIADGLPLKLNSAEEDAEKISSPQDVIEISDHSEELATESSSGQVRCPICADSMTADFLQRKHLDDCLAGKKPAPLKQTQVKKRRDGISLFFQQRKRSKPPQEVDHEEFYFVQAHKHHRDTKKLPKIDFGSASTPKLKEKLAALKLSVLGTRAQQELRYNQYYILHNSNLDSNHPLTDLELRQKLNQWEKSHQAFSAPVGANTLFGDLLSHKSVSDKDFPVKAWQEKYKDEFKQLIRTAKRTRKRKTEKSGQEPGALENEKGKIALSKDGSRSDSIGEITTLSISEETWQSSSLGQNGVPESSTSCDGNDGSLEEEQKAANPVFDFTKSTLFMPQEN